MLTARADHGMTAARLRKAEDGTAGGAFFIDVGFAVTEFVAPQAEKAAEFFIFTASGVNLTREHSRKDRDDQADGENEINERKNYAVHEERHNGMDDHKADIDKKQNLVERIRAVPSVEKAIHGLLEFSHNGIYSACRVCGRPPFCF